MHSKKYFMFYKLNGEKYATLPKRMGAYDYTLPFIEISQRGTILTVVFSTIGIEALIGLGVGTILVFALFAIDQCRADDV